MSNGTFMRSMLSFGGILAVAWSVQHVAQIDLSEPSAQKLERLKPKVNSGNEHTEKVRGPLSTTVDLLGMTPAAGGEAFLLEVTVSSQKVVEGASVRWILPSDVELISGKINQSIAIIAPNAPFKAQITLRQTTPGNKQIHVVATGSLNGTTFSSVSQYNSTNEDLLKSQKEDVLRAIDSSKNRTGRLFH